MQELINKLRTDIWQAIEDYGRYSNQTAVLDDVSDSFVDNLANDSAYAKDKLRTLFRTSPCWDENLQALVINGTRTHDPDIELIGRLGRDILMPAYNAGKITLNQLDWIVSFFQELNEDNPGYVETIDIVAPKAYAKGKKRSRIFKAICQQLGIADETAGSEFQRQYAQFADELTSRKLGFKLFVSIHPAHFITMSNPKGDSRGNTLTSCHSFNSTDYQYNNGCSGYARDETSFIAFTVNDPKDPELFNNRKTTRQVYAYEPGNGVLLQSRFYNTSGGTRGAQEDSQLYRDLIEREISMLENQPNLWKIRDSWGDGATNLVETGDGFGGYADWQYSDFAGKIAIRNDKRESRHRIYVGTWGLCCSCGCETSNGVYCEDCGEPSGELCAECEERVGETFCVHDSRGNEIWVCEYCRSEYFTCCDNCDEYYPRDEMTEADNGWMYCPDCRDSHLEECEDCGRFFRHESDECPVEVNEDEDGNTKMLCWNCRHEDYQECDYCGQTWHWNFIWEGCEEYDYICPCCRKEHWPESLEEEEEE